ncbi:aminotransferase class V-fold PLP-dependent enzyme [Pokkaliibacter sp. MBI-7]|uniref:aminotransferase class V-fold PLP-dependent enzyme n=1 Tax=Pokkaliibacter sp. MBI-7 TaxID=3040600 RepID=UPI00244C9573|nr:aminotransferase class V-fold PLP-dependent enzyme [Pokkaliibacter sp. MBI-7]MDH2433690.1 aminotransferase class V-fold PLP-dependent enzyme [Pokkaliibacter sp. MBI-7]
MTSTVDIQFVRQHFPAFAEPSLSGQAFFDNAGGSYACQQVIHRLQQYYCQTKVQPYGFHPASVTAGQLMDSSHQRLAAYLNVDAEEVHLGPSTSQNTYVLAQAFGKKLQPGDEIIVTNQDHEANSGVWRRLAERGGVVKEWQVDSHSGALDITALSSLLNDKTRLLTFPHCSNILGQINPVADICALARQAGVTTVVDGVSYAGHGLPDVAALGADIYLFSLYKTFGPHLGAMVIRHATAQYLGNQAHYFNAGYIHKWFVPAGPDHAQVAASQGIADYFDQLHAHHFSADVLPAQRAAEVRQLLKSAEQPLLGQLLDFIQQRPNLRLLGPQDSHERVSTLSLLTGEQSPQQVARALAEHGIMAGAGHFYAVRLLEAMGVPAQQGVLRLSFVHYTDQQDMDQLLRALDQLL